MSHYNNSNESSIIIPEYMLKFKFPWKMRNHFSAFNFFSSLFIVVFCIEYTYFILHLKMEFWQNQRKIVLFGIISSQLVLHLEKNACKIFNLILIVVLIENQLLFKHLTYFLHKFMISLPFPSTLKITSDKFHLKCTQFSVLINVERFEIFLVVYSTLIG